MKKLLLILLLINCLAYGQVGIGNIDPKTTLDVSGGLSLREGTPLALVNGVNNNFSLGTTPSSFYRVTNPTAAFTITGLAPATSADGQIVTIENTTAFNFTIAHDAATSIAVNRIYCPGGTNLILSGQYSTVTLSYNASQTHWIVTGSTDNPYGKNIQSAIGLLDTNINSNTFTDMADMSITFTPKHNTVFLNFGASGIMNTGTYPEACYARFRIVNVTSGNTTIAGTNSLVTDYDYDDTSGEIVAVGWNAHFTMFPVNVTAGTSTTLKIQWMRDGSLVRNLLNNVASSKDFSHRNLTIYD